MPTCNGCLRSSFRSLLPTRMSRLAVKARHSQDFVRQAFLQWERQRLTRFSADRDDIGHLSSDGSHASRNIGGSPTSSDVFPGVFLQEIPSAVHTIAGVNSAASDSFPRVDIEEIGSNVHTIPGVSSATASDAFPGVNLPARYPRSEELPQPTADSLGGISISQCNLD